MSISPAALLREMSAVDQIRQLLGVEADPQLLLGTIEGETDALACVDALIEVVVADELLAARGQERIKRLQARAGKHRAILLMILQDKLRLERLQRPLATLTISQTTAHALITDATQVPPQFWRTAIDANQLSKALRDGETVAGAVLSNPHPMLTLRSV